MGIAPTKTLAKVANKYAKKYKGYKGVCLIDTEEKRIKALQKFDIGDVWGVGRRYGKMLRYNGIQTAYDLTQKSRSWVRKNLTVVGERMWSELRGIPCIELDNTAAAKKQICTSRSFGTKLKEFDEIFEAVSNFTASCAAKLRKQQSCAAGMLVFIMTNPFSEKDPQYVNSRHFKLPFPTNSTTELIGYAKMLLKEIYRQGYAYKKAGTIITEIVPDAPIQGDLFDTVDRDRQKRIMTAVDKLNDSYGTYKVRVASQGYGKKWKLKNEQLSPCYTTRLDDVIKVKTDKL
jgi:DNA polymerase V